MSTGIEWADETWNPTTGCNQVSPGCAHCYAKTLTERWGRKFEDVKLHENRLRKPLGWKTPRRVFVNSMSDLFHESIPDEFIDKVFAVMALTPQHQYQVLTKRPERMREYLTNSEVRDFTTRHNIGYAALGMVLANPRLGASLYQGPEGLVNWPLPNVWLGVSVENQHWADVRIPILLDTPAAVRFLSCEPLLEAIDITYPGRLLPTDQEPRIDWVIVGGESGAKRRPFDLEWARDLQRQCWYNRTPLFFKQTGAFKPGQPSGDPELDAAKAWPEAAND